jgi:ABC-type antimicrobial peptide transport system permease subunit
VAAQVTGSLVDAAQVADRVGRVLALLVLAAAFWIATVLTLSSVSKRVRELGTLRALGWRTSRLVRQITAEALVLAVVGGLLGIALGMAATFAVNVLAPPLEATAAAGIRERLLTPAMHRTTRLEAQADSLVILLGLGLAIVGGVIAGAAGSFRAAQLRPAVALRHRG